MWVARGDTRTIHSKDETTNDEAETIHSYKGKEGPTYICSYSHCIQTLDSESQVQLPFGYHYLVLVYMLRIVQVLQLWIFGNMLTFLWVNE